MSFTEVRTWAAYVRKYGSLNIGRRIEQEIARIHHSYLAAKGVKNVKLIELMSHEQQSKAANDDEDELTAYLMKHSEIEQPS